MHALDQVTSKVLTADTAVTGQPCKVWSVTIVSNGANAGTVSLLDGGATGTGVEKWNGTVTATAGACTHAFFPEGLSFMTSLDLDVTTTGKVTITLT